MKKIYFIVFLLFQIINFSLFAQDYSVQSINKDLLESVSAVIREDETKIVIQAQKKMSILKKKVVTVLDKSKDDFSQLYFYFDPQYKIRSLSAHIYNQEGKKIKTIKKSDFLDVSISDGFSLYLDDRALVYKYYPVSYPYTIEYNIESESSNTVFIRDYMPLYMREISVEKSSYQISNLSGIELRKKRYDIGDFKINETLVENGWKYTAENILPIYSETLSPSIDVLVPRVSFSLSKFSLAGKEGSFVNWDEFGKWMYTDLLQSTWQLPDKAKAEIKELIKDTDDVRERVKFLYQYMQNKTRYINIAIGIGGWKPMNASEVFTKGYGDCKGLTNYMYSVLKEAGIPANYTIINSNVSEENFDIDFPKMGGNHVLLCVPIKNDTIWLENTSQTMAFNHLGMSTANRNAIAIYEEGAKIINTPTYDSDTNLENAEYTIYLQGNGDADIKGEMRYEGLQYSYFLGLSGVDQNKLQDIYKNIFSDLAIHKFEECKINNDRDEGIFTVRLSFKTPRYSVRLGDELLFNVIPVGKMKSNISQESNRTLPVEISYGFADKFVFNFILPDEYSMGELPKNILLNSEFGLYQLTFKKEDNNRLKVERILKIKKGVYPKEKYNEYVKFRNNILRIDNTKLNLIKKI